MSFNSEQAYESLYLIRCTEEEIAARYHPADEMRCPTHLSMGQESAAVGVIMALGTGDHLYSNHRCHSHYLAKGGDLDAMIGELYGKANGCTGGRGGSMHLVDESVGFMGASPIVGDCVSLAIGSAMAFKLDGSNRVAVAFMGDSVVETGQFWEAANFAALHRLPIMLVCENNLYATATHISERQPPSPIFERVKGFMWSTQVEDGDVEAVYQAAQTCREARPGFLEIMTYRYREHAGPEYDWDLGYRTKKEVDDRMGLDPIPVVRSKLSEAVAFQIESRIKARVFSAFDAAAAAPWPEALTV